MMVGKFKMIYDLAVLFWFFIFFVFLIIIYFVDTKPYGSKYKGKLNKKYPDKLKPAELSMLLYKKITPEVFTTNIMLLICNGVIEIRKSENDYKMTLNENKVLNLDKQQKYIVNILFDSIAQDNHLKLSVFNDYANNKKNGSEFLTNYYVWKRMTQTEVSSQPFYEYKKNYILIEIYKYITILLVLINILTKRHYLIGYFLIILSIILKLFFYKTYKRTYKYNDEFHKWMGFKQFLLSINDESYNLNKEEKLNYLIYSMILKIHKKIPVRIFDGMDILSFQLNDIVTKCVINAELHAHREIRWK